MNLVLIKIGSKEWEEMWDWVANHPINKGIDNPSLALNGTEGWQYTGSFKQGDRVLSGFRHRYHPVTSSVYSISYAHPSVNEESIDKTFRL